MYIVAVKIDVMLCMYIVAVKFFAILLTCAILLCTGGSPPGRGYPSRGGYGGDLDPPAGMEAGGGGKERWPGRVWRCHPRLHTRRVPSGPVTILEDIGATAYDGLWPPTAFPSWNFYFGPTVNFCIFTS
jgi:hypothetical protein